MPHEPGAAQHIRAPGLDITRWPDGGSPLVVAHLRQSQLDAIDIGFARLTSDHLVIPWHARGVVERTAAGAALLIGGVLLACGQADPCDEQWDNTTTCVVGVVLLGTISRNPFLVAAEFTSMLNDGRALLAEMAVTDIGPEWEP